MDFIKLLEHHILDHQIFTAGNIPVSKHLFMMLISAFIMVVLFAVIPRLNNVVSRKIKTLIEIFIIFVREEILLPVMGEEGKKFTGYFLTLFFFILFCNLLGLVPFGSTATGNISVTAGLALTTLFMIIFFGIKYNGFGGFIKSFLPSGVPVWIVPILFPIEILGLITKTFALSIRLFANMIAGHIVILSFIGLIFLFKSFFIAPVSIAADLALELLEIFIAFLQAFIFTLLTAIFLGSAIQPEH